MYICIGAEITTGIADTDSLKFKSKFMAPALIDRFINQSIEKDQRVIIFYKHPTRSPVLGKFIKCDADLIKKGYRRFVSESKLPAYEKTKNESFGNLQLLSHLDHIKMVEVSGDDYEKVAVIENGR